MQFAGFTHFCLNRATPRHRNSILGLPPGSICGRYNDAGLYWPCGALQPYGGRLENSSVEASLALRLMLLDLPQQAAPVARLWFCADERGCNLAQLGDADAAVSECDFIGDRGEAAVVRRRSPEFVDVVHGRVLSRRGYCWSVAERVFFLHPVTTEHRSAHNLCIFHGHYLHRVNQSG